METRALGIHTPTPTPTYTSPSLSHPRIALVCVFMPSSGLLQPGWVQWMTAGSGLVHSEMPSEELVRDGGTMEGFQLVRTAAIMTAAECGRDSAHVPQPAVGQPCKEGQNDPTAVPGENEARVASPLPNSHTLFAKDTPADAIPIVEREGGNVWVKVIAGSGTLSGSSLPRASCPLTTP